jgi:hypothetical protein
MSSYALANLQEIHLTIHPGPTLSRLRINRPSQPGRSRPSIGTAQLRVIPRRTSSVPVEPVSKSARYPKSSFWRNIVPATLRRVGRMRARPVASSTQPALPSRSEIDVLCITAGARTRWRNLRHDRGYAGAYRRRRYEHALDSRGYSPQFLASFEKETASESASTSQLKASLVPSLLSSRAPFPTGLGSLQEPDPFLCFLRQRNTLPSAWP